jgi:lipopolysaccharide assembly outer membrane protein LptD (OstA)
MALRRTTRRTLFAIVLAVIAGSGGPRAGDDADPTAPKPDTPRAQASGLPAGVSLSAESIRQGDDGSIVADGSVTIESEMGRFQADRITFREGHIVEAEGNVLVVFGENRISGTRMVYDMGIKDDPDPDKRIPRGLIENAIGQVEPEFYFEARKVETIGQDRVILHTATVTTCTQPVPYWSFHVSKAKIKIEGYAHLFNLRPTIGKVPVFYMPYLLWPVKRDRAPGLLFPEFGTTTTRGRLISIPVFIPLGASADVTVMPQYFTIAGWGVGTKIRLVPNSHGYAEASGQYIWDQVTGDGRYRAQLKQTQTFLNGFRMVSDVDIVSDFDYYTDYVRNLTYSSSPTLLGRITFSRSGSWTSLLVQEQYRKQLFPSTLDENGDGILDDGPTLVQTTLPEIEWRGRSKKLGKSPVYFSFVSSFSGIRQEGERIDTDYLRGDFGPTISLPWSPAPWIDITPSLAYRTTYWSKHQIPPPVPLPGEPQADPTIVDEALWRSLFGASLDIRGPKLFKIFEKEQKPAEDGTARPPTKYKNTIEPRVVYTYQQAYDRGSDVIIYDEVDRFGTVANALSYGIASRLIGQRPRSAPESMSASGEKILAPEGESGKLREVVSESPEVPGDVAVEAPPPTDAPLEPVEIASLELAQTYSLTESPFEADTNADGTIDSVSRYSAITLTGRYNPTRAANFSFTSRYDVLFNQVSEVSVSGNFRERLAKGLFSFVYRPGLGTEPVPEEPPDPTTPVVFVDKHDATQLRFQGDFGPFAGRLRLGMDATFNITPKDNEKTLPYQRWRLEYYTQCCGFLAEYLHYDYTTAPRREFRFAVDLRGIGKLFDFNQANQ